MLKGECEGVDGESELLDGESESLDGESELLDVDSDCNNAKLISSAEVRVKYFPQFASPPPEFFNDSLPEVSVTLPFSRIV